MNSGVHAVLSGVLVPPAWPFKHKDAIFASSRASADGGQRATPGRANCGGQLEEEAKRA
jgi:hypothetical protein